VPIEASDAELLDKRADSWVLVLHYEKGHGVYSTFDGPYPTRASAAAAAPAKAAAEIAKSPSSCWNGQFSVVKADLKAVPEDADLEEDI
jgi:hypothetical protein